MHLPEVVYQCLKRNGIHFFSGVPDSLLKDFCFYLSQNLKNDEHVIAPNEGVAVALAAGHYIQSGNPGLVYLQNSGIGNAINPLLSLADREVYGIPMILLIGWRGEPGVADEPQHIKQGRIMPRLLDALEIPWFTLGAQSDVDELFGEAIVLTKELQSPVAILVHKGTFASYTPNEVLSKTLLMSRDEVIEKIVNSLDDQEIIVSSTGMISRELNECRIKHGFGEGIDFLTVGSMGHASAIALGIAKKEKKVQIICLDGDGAALMHMGSMSSIGKSSSKNFIHIVLNNGAHDSVGGQPTLAFEVNLPEIARACGYIEAIRIRNFNELDVFLKNKNKYIGPTFVEIFIKKGARPNLGRPGLSPRANLNIFMERLGFLANENSKLE